MKEVLTNPRTNWRRGEILICLFLALITLGVYWPVRNYEFVSIDDWAYVTGNANTQRGLSAENFKWAFQTRYAGNWHPLTTLSHMLDCQLFGLDAGAHHLTNLLFHLANTVLLFALLKRMTGALRRSAMVAALFALHPLHVESVAWISERKDVLSGFFFLLTIWAYARYAEKRADSLSLTHPLSHLLTYYSLALIFFTLGLLSKPMLVTLPFVLLLLDYWPLKRIFKVEQQGSAATQRWHSEFKALPQLFLEKIPFFVVAAASSVITFFAQHDGGAVVPLKAFSFGPRLGNALVSYVRYIGKTIWPDSLAVFYPYQGGWQAWQIIGSILLLAAITVAAILMWRRRGYLFVGWFWFLGTLVPVIGLVQVGSQSMADRYTYLPHIGMFIALTWGISELLAKWRARAIFSQAGSVLLLVACATTTSLQVRHWKNTETLLTHAVSVTKNNAPAHHYLAVVLEEKGDISKAISHYLETTRITRDFVPAHYRLAEIYARQKEFTQARARFLAVVHYQPEWPAGRFGFAEFLMKQDENQEAENEYRAAIKAKPDFAEAHYQLAVLLGKQKQTGDSIKHFKEAISIKPDWLEPLNNLAWLLATHPEEKFRDGRFAVTLAERAAEVSGHKNPGVLDTLAAAYAEAGRFDDAANAAEEALTLATAANQTEFTTQVRERLQLYKSKQPFRE